MADEVPSYELLQQEVARAAGSARHALELGTGTGSTALAVGAAQLVGLDESAEMIAAAHERLPAADLRVGRLQDPLPDGPFDLVFSALAVHHLAGHEKADLFRRVTSVLEPGGRFVLGDLIVPEDPADVVTPIDGEFDIPSTIAEQLEWLTAAGLRASVAWRHRDLAVLVGQA